MKSCSVAASALPFNSAGIDEWTVDLITWNKGRIGMGYRTRRTAEYLIVLQKTPKRAKGVWTRHDIPDVWTEKPSSKVTHSKPVEVAAGAHRVSYGSGRSSSRPCRRQFQRPRGLSTRREDVRRL